MSAADELSPDQRFLEKYFSAANQIQIPSPGAKTASEMLLLDLVADVQSPEALPWLLPCRRATDTSVTWYAISLDYAQFRGLGYELKAAVGAPYTNFTPEKARLNHSDPIEAAFAELPKPFYVYRFTVQGDYGVAAQAAIDTLRSNWHRQPRRTWKRVRPLGRVLRDFELALAGSRRLEAEAHLQELERNRQLSALNLLFQRFRLAARFVAAEDLLALDVTEALLEARRPRQVTLAMQRAVSDSYLLDADDHPLPPATAVSLFRDDINQRYGALVRTLTPVDDVACTRLQMLAAASTNPPATAFAEAILQAWEGTEHLAWLTEVWSTRVVDDDAAPTLATTMRDGDLDSAWTLALQMEPTAASVAVLVTTAIERQDPESTATALAAIDQLSKAERENLNANRLMQLAVTELRSQTAEYCDSWRHWFERLDTGTLAQPLEVLDEGIARWPAQGFMTSTAAKELAEQFVRTRTVDTAQVVTDAVPRALMFVERSEASTDVVAPLLLALLQVLTYESELTASDLATIADLADRLLAHGLADQVYADLLNDLMGVWDRVKSPQRLDWATDVLGTVASCPAPIPTERDRFAIALYGQVTAYRDRSTEEQRLVLRLIAGDFGFDATVWQPDAVASDTDGQRTNPLADLTIGIYSLDESASARVARWIAELAPSARVTLNHEHDGSDRLTALAKNSDVVVIGWATAKHAATNHIRAHRPSDKPTVMASGRGATAMFRALITTLDRP